METVNQAKESAKTEQAKADAADKAAAEARAQSLAVVDPELDKAILLIEGNIKDIDAELSKINVGFPPAPLSKEAQWALETVKARVATLVQNVKDHRAYLDHTLAKSIAAEKAAAARKAA